MNDHHKRFRERFGPTLESCRADKKYPALVENILAFIDEVVAERNTQGDANVHAARRAGEIMGRAEERAAIIEKVEGMRNECERARASSQGTYRMTTAGAQRDILDDLLTSLRGEGYTIMDEKGDVPDHVWESPQEETEAGRVGGIEERVRPYDNTGFAEGIDPESLDLPQEETECCAACCKEAHCHKLCGTSEGCVCSCHKPRTEGSKECA